MFLVRLFMSCTLHGAYLAAILAGFVVVAGSLACTDPGPDGRQQASGEKPAQARTAAIAEGMTMEQVLSAWGSPNVKVRQGKAERWSYWLRDEQRRVVGKTYIFFDDQGRVSEILAPRDEKPERKTGPPAPIARSTSPKGKEKL